jgi:hypothetical protein
MGRAWAPAVASLFMASWDDTVSAQLLIKPRLFVRYIDDVLMVFNNQHDAQLALNVMRTANASIKVGEASIGSTGHFLDLHLTIVPCSTINWSLIPHSSLFGVTNLSSVTTWAVRTSLYRKETDLYVLLHFHSLHSWHVKANTVFSQLVRTLRLTNAPASAGSNIRLLLDAMLALRCMPSRLKRSLWRQLLLFAAKEFISATSSTSNSGTSSAHFPSVLRLPPEVDSIPFARVLQDFYTSLDNRSRAYTGHLCVRWPVVGSIQSILFRA